LPVDARFRSLLAPALRAVTQEGLAAR